MYPLKRGIFLILCLTFGRAFAQESVTQETNAPSIKWYQINTKGFRILYPKEFETQAQRVANTLETIREPEGKSMGAVPRKISVVLQSNSSLSNGFVTVAPRRSEFYAMPTQNYNFAGTNDWLNMLASHEYRHMVQFQRSLTGFNRFAYYLFGQQASAGLAFAAVPQWFWEGDAVATETAFTRSGRGRIPQFDMVFRTNIMEGRTFNYHKQYLRSYKHNIPNHYVLGYNMVSYLRKKTGDPDIWEKVTGRAWNIPFIPFTFSNALKKETGLYVTDLFKEMAAARKKDYEEAISGLEFSSFKTVNKRQNETYTDYSYPQPLDNGKVAVVKAGIGDIEQVVVLDKDGNEDERYVQGVVSDAGMLSATNQRVVWNEMRYDPRWTVRTYSVIKGYDFGAKKAVVVSKHSRYSAAALSPDGYKVATIETSVDYKIRLVVIDYFSGKVIKEFENPENDLLAMPRWTEDGAAILVLRTNAKGKTISSVSFDSGSSTDLTPVSNENLGYPVSHGNYLFFNSPITGIDNIFAIDLTTKQRYQITTSKYGAFNPAISKDGSVIYYNDQTRDGLDVVKMPFDPNAWKKFMNDAPSESNLTFDHLVKQEGDQGLFNSIPQTAFKSKRYHRASGMINPHSWGPYFLNSLTSARLGIASQDVLSTTSINAGYVYDINERTGSWQAAMSYQGQFPILDVSVSQSTRAVNEGNYLTKVVTGNDSTILNRNVTFKWDEQNVEAGLRIPLVTTSSKYYGNFMIGNSVGLTHITNFRNSVNNERTVPRIVRDGKIEDAYLFYNYVGPGNLIYNHFSMSGYRLMKQSRRDINSKWGQSFYLTAYNTPYGGDYSGSQFSFYTTLLFPGLAKHHSLWGYWGYQRTQINRTFRSSDGFSVIDNTDYLFRNQIPLPRGQSVARFQNFYTMSANYTFPLWYPDIAIGPLLNIQRLRANAFFDYGFGSSTFVGTVSQAYTSVGGELKVDINVFRFLPQFNVGVRYSYGLTPAVTRFEVLVGAINF